MSYTQACHAFFFQDTLNFFSFLWNRPFSSKMPRTAPIQREPPNQPPQSTIFDLILNLPALFCQECPISTARAPTTPSIFVNFWPMSSSDGGGESPKLGAGPSEDGNDSPDPIDPVFAARHGLLTNEQGGLYRNDYRYHTSTILLVCS